jgi:hypothetical protein
VNMIFPPRPHLLKASRIAGVSSILVEPAAGTVQTLGDSLGSAAAREMPVAARNWSRTRGRYMIGCSWPPMSPDTPFGLNKTCSS